MSSVVLDLSISPLEFERLYAGSATSVVARARDGRRVRFPARILQPFVTHDGIQGSFRVEFDRECRFKGIRKL